MNEINIAEILKDKPKGLKLYSPVYGKVKFEAVHKDKIYFYHGMNEHSVKSNGKSFDEGEMVIFPSKDMRDWSKFTWKKGDVLTNDEVFVIFKRWENPDYSQFFAQYEIEPDYTFHENSFRYTNEFRKVSGLLKLDIIKKFEEHYGGKLNLETLKIEKPKQEFKEGDFLRFEGDYDLVTIFAAYTSDGSWHEHASISLGSMELQTGLHITANDCEGYKVRLANEEEKKILLDALDENGYAWNPETKKVEKKAKTSPALQVGKYYYFEVESEMAYVAKLIERNVIDTLRFGENIVWNPRKTDFREAEYNDTTLIYKMRNCGGIRPANLYEMKMLEQKRRLRDAKLEPFCKVLVRDNKEGQWKPAFFVKISKTKNLPYNCVSLDSGHNSSYKYCIPYEGNESLAFTNSDVPL